MLHNGEKNEHSHLSLFPSHNIYIGNFLFSIYLTSFFVK
nr:MAG TPA: hypothetical protein [Caudoviricetes sp.]